ncbi:MAG: hypothetical protein WCO10_00360 [bacterium]
MNALENRYDEMIESVSPVLIEGYERTSLIEGRTLMGCNEDLKRNNVRSRFWDKLLPKVAVGSIIILPLVYYMITYDWHNIPDTRYAVLILCPLVIFTALLLFLMSYVDGKKLEILCAINNSVEALDRFGRMLGLFPHPPGVLLCESLIYRELVFIASEIVNGELKFEALRLDRSCGDETVVQVGLEIQRRRQTLENKLKAAASFGLKYDRKKIFAEAKKMLGH